MNLSPYNLVNIINIIICFENSYFMRMARWTLDWLYAIQWYRSNKDVMLQCYPTSILHCKKYKLLISTLATYLTRNVAKYSISCVVFSFVTNMIRRLSSSQSMVLLIKNAKTLQNYRRKSLSVKQWFTLIVNITKIKFVYCQSNRCTGFSIEDPTSDLIEVRRKLGRLLKRVT